MHLTNFHFYPYKNYLYSKPVKGLRGYEVGYGFAFNGKELDLEGMGGGSSTYDYGFRIYNAQLGKFLSVDPLTKLYSFYSPYHSAGNTPIQATDKDGTEPEYMVDKQGKLTAPVLVLFNYLYGYRYTMMTAVNITIGGNVSSTDNANTWNATTVITAPLVRSDYDWIATLSHEFNHVKEFDVFRYSTFPPICLRGIHSVLDYIDEKRTGGKKIAPWHQKSWDQASLMNDFLNENPEILEKLQKKVLTTKEIKIAVYTFKIGRLDYDLTQLGWQLTKAKRDKNDKLVKQKEQEISNLNKEKEDLTKKLEETKKE